MQIQYINCCIKIKIKIVEAIIRRGKIYINYSNIFYKNLQKYTLFCNIINWYNSFQVIQSLKY